MYKLIISCQFNISNCGAWKQSMPLDHIEVCCSFLHSQDSLEAVKVCSMVDFLQGPHSFLSINLFLYRTEFYTVPTHPYIGKEIFNLSSSIFSHALSWLVSSGMCISIGTEGTLCHSCYVRVSFLWQMHHAKKHKHDGLSTCESWELTGPMWAIYAVLGHRHRCSQSHKRRRIWRCWRRRLQSNAGFALVSLFISTFFSLSYSNSRASKRP